MKIAPPKLPQFKLKFPDRVKLLPSFFKRKEKKKQTQQLAPAIETERIPQPLQPVKLLYSKYDCLWKNPLTCEVAQQTLAEQPTATVCLECGFPLPLAPETKIKGDRSTYQIERMLHHRGMGRLYEATQQDRRSSVILKEYLLPKRYFNPQEIRQRQERFMLVAGINLADGRVQDPRLITPIEAIAPMGENRCYSISKGQLDAFPTLASYLLEKGAFSSEAVRQVLEQVLQSLEFLHGQKFRLRSGALKQGLAHGNLSLDSLLIVPNLQGFFIYLCDLALWENQFNYNLSDPNHLSQKQDLKDLGYIAFYLLAGRSFDPVTEHHLEPKIDENWPPVNLALKNFILNLIGVGSVKLETAEIARQHLLTIPPEAWGISSPAVGDRPPEEITIEPEAARKKIKARIIWFLFATLGLVLLGVLIWWLIQRRQDNAVAREPICCIDKVAGIPQGEFIYTAPENGTWNYLLQQQNLIAPGKTLGGELNKKLQPEDPTKPPPVRFNYLPQPTSAEAIAKVLSGEADFAITNLGNARAEYDNLIYTELGYERFGYDGLVVFVPFSYYRRTNGLPGMLNGTITFEQLRQLYTGKIQNWQELGGPDLPVNLYIPNEDEAVKVFKARVLKTERAIAEFEKLRQTERQPGSLVVTPARITTLSTFEMLKKAIRDFEERNIGSIGFGTLSKVFGQCAVYPLALVEDDRPAISPLIRDRPNLPITPETDLCNDKGSYYPNVSAFVNGSYPLAYPLVVVYARDNRLQPVGEKFAEILTTVEAQRLLALTGVIPVLPGEE